MNTLDKHGIPTFNASGFADYLKHPATSLGIDLSHSTLIEVINEMIAIKSQLSPRYGKHYSSLLKSLRDMERDFHCVLEPLHVSDIFWNNFIPYLTTKGISLSTVRTLCFQLRSAIEWGSKHGARISDTYDYLKVPNYYNQQIALTPDEISHIAHFDINTIPRRPQYRRHMERVRDMFVLSCSLGQRYSDMIRINRHCFDRNIFSIVQQKTGVGVRVDIDKMAMDSRTTYRLLEKYDYYSPMQTDISVYDRYLKQLLVYIGNEFFHVLQRGARINGQIETTTHEKYKLVSSHTARRSFITNNILRGYTPIEVMRASGHKSFSTFEHYLCYFDNY